MSKNITKIGENAFYGCSNLTNVTIDNNVTSIDDKAFYGYSAFDGCNKLTSITFTGNTQQWNDIIKADYWNADVPATEVVCDNGKVSLQ